jgi:hypothetical protein
MTSLQYCKYRNKSNLAICNCKKILNDVNFCIKHYEIKDDIKRLYEDIYDVVKYKKNLESHDYYLIFKKIQEEDFINILLNLSKNKIIKIFDKYGFDKIKKKSILIKNIIGLFKNTLNIENNSMINVIFIQKKFRIKQIIRFTNNEDPFTYTLLDELSYDSIFSYKENNNIYGFDAVELLYFIEKNNKEGIESYNPYTRKPLDDNLAENLNIFIAKNKLIKKDVNKCIWISDLHAYTDLSYIIEKAGFYNSPEWFLKLKNRELICIIKLYIFLTNNKTFFTFKNKGTDSLVFYFCKESIKLFNNYNDNYTLCCCFIKALSIISNDFYINLPEWIIDIETSNRSIFDINNFLLFYYISV